MTTQEVMGLRIKALRELRKLSQTELAEKVGYKDKTAIAKVEAGKVDLPQSKIYAFAKALGTTISYLFSEDNVGEHQTLSAHFDNGEYTVAELDEINQFANFVKSKRN
ncbi:MAG: helix-turn-helix transcriptional regulator [Lachnobacterium sp.]|nr:helix-turn-helix transcriptional regulator [Lachnobacterium sp.]